MTSTKELLREALRLLREEHDAHHSKCCMDPGDLCHIGQFFRESARFV